MPHFIIEPSKNAAGGVDRFETNYHIFLSARGPYEIPPTGEHGFAWQADGFIVNCYTDKVEARFSMQGHSKQKCIDDCVDLDRGDQKYLRCIVHCQQEALNIA